MDTDLSPHAASPSPAKVPAREGWTPGRVVALAVGAFLALISLGLLAGSAVLTVADLHQLGGGYLTTGTASYASPGYALATEPVQLHGGWGWLGRFVSDVRIQITPADPARPVFVAIAPAADVQPYLAGTSYGTVSAVGDQTVTEHAGSAVPAVPASIRTWVAQTAGTGTRTLSWTTSDGDWMAVVMNSDGSRGVAVRAQVAVSSPMLAALAGELLTAGVFAGVAAAALIIVPIRLASRKR
jgi:hypothetical protein